MSGIQSITGEDEPDQKNPAQTEQDHLIQPTPTPSTESVSQQPCNRYAFSSLDAFLEAGSVPSSPEPDTPLKIASSLMGDQIDDIQIEFLSEFLERPENKRYKFLKDRIDQLIEENYCDEKGKINHILYKFAMTTQFIAWDILLQEATISSTLSKEDLEPLLRIRGAVTNILSRGLEDMVGRNFRPQLLMMETYLDIFSSRSGLPPTFSALFPDQKEGTLQLTEDELDARITFMRACRESAQKISEVDPSNKFDFLKSHQEKFGPRRLSNIVEQRNFARAEFS